MVVGGCGGGGEWWVVGGGWWWWWWLRPILVFSLSLDQAEQKSCLGLDSKDFRLGSSSVYSTPPFYSQRDNMINPQKVPKTEDFNKKGLFAPPSPRDLS